MEKSHKINAGYFHYVVFYDIMDEKRNGGKYGKIV